MCIAHTYNCKAGYIFITNILLMVKSKDPLKQFQSYNKEVIIRKKILLLFNLVRKYLHTIKIYTHNIV